MNYIKKNPIVFVGVFILILILAGVGWLALINRGVSLSEGILYTASQDPENKASKWSIHELLLTPDSDMDSILASYSANYEQYVHDYRESFTHDEESLQAIRPEWLDAVGENGNKGFISAVDLEWPGWWITREEVLEIVKPYQGQYRAIPVFAPDFSEIVDYFLVGIS